MSFGPRWLVRVKGVEVRRILEARRTTRRVVVGSGAIGGTSGKADAESRDARSATKCAAAAGIAKMRRSCPDAGSSQYLRLDDPMAQARPRLRDPHRGLQGHDPHRLGKPPLAQNQPLNEFPTDLYGAYEVKEETVDVGPLLFNVTTGAGLPTGRGRSTFHESGGVGPW
jgi:hypothetical protein